LDEAVRRLIENTDDAYGFPPFATFGPRIRIGDDDYEALRRKEVELLTQAIAGARRWHLRVPGHEWADVLPSVIDGSAPVAVGPGPMSHDPRPIPVGGDFVSEPVPAFSVAFHATGAEPPGPA
jgi:hypothetical protein